MSYATQVVRKYLIGQVIARGTDKIPTVKIRIPKMKLDKYLLMYFNHPDHCWAVDQDSDPSQIGDIVKIQPLRQRATPEATHLVCERLFKTGNIIDPVTGRRCRGTQFIDEEFRESIKEKLEKESGTLLK